MKEKRKRKLKKFRFHPVTSLIFLTGFVIVLSWILSKLNLQGSYKVIDSGTLEFRTIIVNVNNMLSYDGFKYMFSQAASIFASSSGLITLLMGLVGISVAHGTGLIDAFIRKTTFKMNNKVITFGLILLAMTSNLVNDIGYV